MKRKYDIIDIMRNAKGKSSLEIITNIKRDIFETNKSPKEVFIVIVRGSKIKLREVTETDGEKTDHSKIKEISSFIKVHVYDNMFDAVKKLNKEKIKGKNIEFFIANWFSYIAIRIYAVSYPAEPYFITQCITEESLIKFTRMLVKKKYATITLHF